MENQHLKILLIKKQTKTNYSSHLLPHFTADSLIMSIPWLSIIKSWNNSWYTKHHTLKKQNAGRDEDIINTEHIKTELMVHST